MKRYLALLRMNLTASAQRPGLALTIVIGVTCAVAVLVSMLAMGVGARRQIMGDVRADRLVVMSIDAQSRLQSSIARDVASSISELPGIKRGVKGQPVAVFEALILMEARKKRDGTRLNFPLLGVSPGLADLRPEMHLTAGRMFNQGLRELIASNACARQYTGFDIDEERPIQASDWRVVGHFDQGHAQESCIVYADSESILTTFKRDTYNQVMVMLQSVAGYSEFLRALDAYPTLRVQARHESEVLADEFKHYNGILDFASYFVGTIMGIGATLGALNSLYAIVDARRRELATLRALGFGSGVIIASMLSESMLLALPGALLGSALAWILFNGLSASPFGFTFNLAVTPSLVLLGIAWALGVGLLGGLLPALRAAHIPVTAAFRAA
jgi:putative ABC transport system permease protein